MDLVSNENNNCHPLKYKEKKVKTRTRTRLTIDEMQYAKQLIEKKSKQHKMRGVVQTIKKPHILHKGFTPLVPKKESRPKKDIEKSVQVVLIVVLLIVLV